MTINLKKVMASPTLAEIAAAEVALCLTLPSDYINFLIIGNGAKPEPNLFDTASNGKSSIVEFFALGNLVIEKRYLDSANPSAKVPIAGAAGGDWVCIETLSKGYGTIWFADHELPGDDAFSPLSDNIEKFLAKLMPWTLNAHAIKPKNVVNSWIDPVFLQELKQKS